MNPLAIIGMILPVIEQIPNVEGGIMALWRSVSKMAQGGFSPAEVFGAVEQSLPAITSAIVANTKAGGELISLPPVNVAPPPQQPVNVAPPPQQPLSGD